MTCIAKNVRGIPGDIGKPAAMIGDRIVSYDTCDVKRPCEIGIRHACAQLILMHTYSITVFDVSL